jgi:hypothetical protein
MTDPTEWPEYDVGPRESVFALGVASVNYARLEFAFSGVFGKVLGKTNKEVWAVLPTLTNDKRLREMRKHLKGLDWPNETKDRVAHFIKAFKILVGNRNFLDHSAIFAGVEGPTALYKYDRKGNTIHIVLTTAEFRQIADEMMTYNHYGLLFGNSIGPKGELNTLFFKTWPDQPPLPRALNYTSKPIAIRSPAS